jgi:hypothetical protein
MDALNKNNITQVLVYNNFESDKKNKTNKCDVVVSSEILQSIENGCPIEVLEGLNLPIFYYNTQITIHGYFPELHTSNIGYYKNIFQNANKSIGIRYSAIDWNKKIVIRDAVRLNTENEWKCGYNSSEFYVYKAKQVNSENELLEVVSSYKKDLTKFNKDVVFGNYQVFVSSVYGQTYVVLKVEINAIYQNRLYEFVALVSEYKSQVEFENAKKVKEANDKLESDKRHQEYEIKRQKECEVKKAKYDSLVATLNLTKEIKSGGLYISHTNDYNICVFKVDGDKVWRYVESDWSDNSELYAPINKRDKSHKLDTVKSANVIKKIKEVGLYLFK